MNETPRWPLRPPFRSELRAAQRMTLERIDRQLAELDRRREVTGRLPNVLERVYDREKARADELFAELNPILLNDAPDQPTCRACGQVIDDPEEIWLFGGLCVACAQAFDHPSTRPPTEERNAS